MPEAFAWPEGSIWVFTGNMAASAVVAFAKNTNATPAWGWNNRPAAGGTYYDHLTGQRLDVTIQAVYTYNSKIAQIAESATAVHMKFLHSGVNGTAGMLMYTGRIDKCAYVGSEAQPFTYTINAHFNVWSAFG